MHSHRAHPGHIASIRRVVVGKQNFIVFHSNEICFVAYLCRTSVTLATIDFGRVQSMASMKLREPWKSNAIRWSISILELKTIGVCAERHKTDVCAIDATRFELIICTISKFNVRENFTLSNYCLTRRLVYGLLHKIKHKSSAHDFDSRSNPLRKCTANSKIYFPLILMCVCVRVQARARKIAFAYTYLTRCSAARPLTRAESTEKINKFH